MGFKVIEPRRCLIYCTFVLTNCFALRLNNEYCWKNIILRNLLSGYKFDHPINEAYISTTIYYKMTQLTKRFMQIGAENRSLFD